MKTPRRWLYALALTSWLGCVSALTFALGSIIAGNFSRAVSCTVFAILFLWVGAQAGALLDHDSRR